MSRVSITILGPAQDEESTALRDRVKAALQRDLKVEGAAAVILVYSSATGEYRIEAANEHLSRVGLAGGTARLRSRVADVRAIVEGCGARVAPS